jgi:oligoribonuclease (3'-5' exoribonuclease)
MTRELYPLPSGKLIATEMKTTDENGTRALSLLSTDALGVRAAGLYVELDKAFWLIAAAASCYWGCGKKKHIVENLLRRTYNYGFSAFRLALLGFYDEAIGILRGVAELTNLLQLLSADRTLVSDWDPESGIDVWVKYNPEKVRNILQNNKRMVPIVDRDTYRHLCRMGVHVTSTSAHSSYRSDARTVVGADVSPVALILIMNQLTALLGHCIRFGSQLAITDTHLAREVFAEGERISRLAAPKLLVTNYAEWANTTNLAASFAAVEALSKALMENPHEIEFTLELDPDQAAFLKINKVRPCAVHYDRRTGILKQHYPTLELSVIYRNVTEDLIQELAKQYRPIEDLTHAKVSTALDW